MTDKSIKPLYHHTNRNIKKINTIIRRIILSLVLTVFLFALFAEVSSAISVVSEKKITSDNTYKDRMPAWSPDGQWLAFATTRGGGWGIYKVKVDGSSITKLHNSGSSLEPSWDPMNKILFSIAKFGYEDVYMMNNDGSGVARLTTAANFDEYPDWSPDGSRIVWSSAGGSNTGEPKQLWVMNADGSNKKRLNTIYGIQPAWSPDGTKIAFKSYASGKGNIWVMNADGSNQKQLTFDSANTHDPDWSPDSKYITYASNKDGDWDIYVMNADGSNVQKLTLNDGFEDNYPAWSRDGNYIAYASNRTGNQEIWVMKINYIATPVPTPTPSPTISVVSPNGGESWVRGTAHTISWTSSGSPGTYVKIELLKAGALNSIITSSTANDGSHSWTIPSTQALGSDYKVRITSTSNSAYTDTSNSNFIISTVAPSPTPTPTPTPSGNLAPNPGFESDGNGDKKPDSWLTNVWGGNASKIAFSWATDYKYSGTHSVKITSTDSTGKARWITDRNIAVIPGKSYTFNTYIKTSGTGKAYIYISFWSKSLGYISGTGTGQISGTNTWKLVSGKAVAPVGAAYARIELRTEGSGTVWYDDVAFKTT